MILLKVTLKSFQSFKHKENLFKKGKYKSTEAKGEKKVEPEKV